MDLRYKRLWKNTILVFFGKAGSSIVAMIMLPFYTHWLSTSQYGIADIINTYALIIAGVVGCSIADGIFIFPKDQSHKVQCKYFTSGFIFLIINSIGCGIIFIIYKLAGTNLGFQNVFFIHIKYIFGLMVSQLAENYVQQFTRSIDKMLVYSITGIIQTISLAFLSLLLIPIFGLSGYILAMIGGNIIAAIYSLIFSKSYHYLSFKYFSARKLKDLLIYGLPLVPNGIMWWLVNGINRPFMEKFAGLKAVGLFAVANKFPAVLTLLCGIFTTAWSITVMEEFNKPDFNYFFNKTMKFVFLISIIFGCMISILSPLILCVFADNSYFEAWKLIPTLIFGIILQNLSSQIGNVFMAEKESKYFLYTSFFGGGASIISTYICIKYFGLTGAPWAIALSFLIMVIARMWYAWKYINEIKIWYYIVMCFIYIIFNFIILENITSSVKILLYSALFILIYFFNMKEFRRMYIVFRNILHKG